MAAPRPSQEWFQPRLARHHFGHLRWNLVPSDQDRYYENTKWAEKVRARAASKALEPGKRHVVFQAQVESHPKTSD
jgi:hypothetical protein